MNLDKDSAGGRAVSSQQQSVFVNGELAMTDGSHIGPHPGVLSSSVTSGSGTVRVEGKAIARKKDSLSCGHQIAQASPTVRAGG